MLRSSRQESSLAKGISEHPLFVWLVIIGTVLPLAIAGYNALRPPEISADPIVDPSRPFAFPFTVKNESWVFPMSDTQLLCGIDSIRWRGGGGVEQLTITDTSRATIAPQGAGLFRCVLDIQGGPASPFDLVRGHIFVSVTYRTLWFPRRSPEAEFTWLVTGSPPHWVKGKIAQ